MGPFVTEYTGIAVLLFLKMIKIEDKMMDFLQMTVKLSSL